MREKLYNFNGKWHNINMGKWLFNDVEQTKTKIKTKQTKEFEKHVFLLFSVLYLGLCHLEISCSV